MRIRAATVEDARGIAEAQVASWRTTYHGIMPDDYLANLSVEGRERSWVRQLGETEFAICAYVAEDNSGQAPRIVGFAAGGPRREGSLEFEGELYAIYLLAATQGQGIGRRLAREVAARLIRDGMSSMLVWVLDANPSRRFYEALGGELLPERQKFTVDGTELIEVSYGWRDLADLRRE